MTNSIQKIINLLTTTRSSWKLTLASSTKYPDGIIEIETGKCANILSGYYKEPYTDESFNILRAKLENSPINAINN